MRKQGILMFTSGFVTRLMLLCSILFAVLQNGCEKGRVNPLDVGGPAYMTPSLAELSGLAEGTTLTQDSLNLVWRGNTGFNEYKYVLTNLTIGRGYDSSNGWTSDTVLNIRHLDDSHYEFSISTRYEGADSCTTYNVDFWVQAHSTPALVFMRKCPPAAVGEQFEIDVWGEGIQGLAAGDFAIRFDNAALQFVGYSEGTLHDTSGVSQNVMMDYIEPNQLGQANDSGLVRISTFVTAQSAEGSTSMSGTGSILCLYFVALQPVNSELTFAGTYLVDSDGNRLSIPSVDSATIIFAGGE